MNDTAYTFEVQARNAEGDERPFEPGERDPGRRRQHRAGAPERDDDRACARADL